MRRVVRKQCAVVVVAVWVLFHAVGAEATTIYSQPALYPTALGGWASAFPGDFFAFDSFELTSPASVLSMTWQGMYFGTPAPTADVTGFHIWFFDDASGSPGAASSATFYPVADTNQTFVAGQPFQGNPALIFNYALNLAAPLALSGGTDYWLMIVAQYSAAPSARWAWTHGTGGDGTSLQTLGVFSNYETRVPDLAFSLSDTPIPEPATLLLFGTGLAAAGVRRYRQRQK